MRFSRRVHFQSGETTSIERGAAFHASLPEGNRHTIFLSGPERARGRGARVTRPRAVARASPRATPTPRATVPRLSPSLLAASRLPECDSARSVARCEGGLTRVVSRGGFECRPGLLASRARVETRTMPVAPAPALAHAARAPRARCSARARRGSSRPDRAPRLLRAVGSEGSDGFRSSPPARGATRRAFPPATASASYRDADPDAGGRRAQWWATPTTPRSPAPRRIPPSPRGGRGGGGQILEAGPAAAPRSPPRVARARAKRARPRRGARLLVPPPRPPRSEASTRRTTPTACSTARAGSCTSATFSPLAITPSCSTRAGRCAPARAPSAGLARGSASAS